MRNRAPIFVVGFQRGGTNILTNLVASHPGTVPLERETHQVFYGRAHERAAERWTRRALYAPIVAAARRHVFRPASLADRPRLPRLLLGYADLLLWLSRERGHADRRLVCKNVNGLALATPLFRAMYPDATFVALVRNGLALCEGYVRRGWRAETFGRCYARIAARMLEDAERVPGYHLARFETMVCEPVATARRLHAAAGLDPAAVTRYRLQAKPSMTGDGSRSYTFDAERDRAVCWFEPHELSGCFRPDVDANQIRRLAPEDRRAFLSEAGAVMERLGYV